MKKGGEEGWRTDCPTAGKELKEERDGEQAVPLLEKS